MTTLYSPTFHSSNSIGTSGHLGASRDYPMCQALRIFGPFASPCDLALLICAAFCEVVPRGTAVIYLIKPGTNSLYALNAAGGYEAVFTGHIMSREETATGRAMANARNSEFICPVSDIVNLKRDISKSITGALVLPLMQNSVPFGAITLYFTEGFSYQMEKTAKLESLASEAALALDHSIALELSHEYALKDPGTNLPNYRALCSLLEQRISEQHSNASKGLALMHMELGHFADCQELGCFESDQALVELSQVIALKLDAIGTLTRYSRDEFIAVLPSCSSLQAKELAENVRLAIASHYFNMSSGASARERATVRVACYTRGSSIAEFIDSVRGIRTPGVIGPASFAFASHAMQTSSSEAAQ